MIELIQRTRTMSSPLAKALFLTTLLAFALVGAFGLAVSAQETPAANPAPQATSPDATQQPAAASAAPSAQPPASSDAQQPALAPEAGSTAETSAPGTEAGGGITEDELKQMLVGKQLFLRGGYLFDSLSYNVHGMLIGRSPHASYTLCGVEINKVHLTKHKVELEGQRYGLHFLGALPYEDPTKALDWVKITPKKKLVRITIDREFVIKVKKEKDAKLAKGAPAKTAPSTAAGNAAPGEVAAAAPGDVSAGSSAGSSSGVSSGVSAGASANPQPGAQPGPAAGAEATATAQAPETSGADQLKADIAATPESERPADWTSITTTTSPAHATKILKQALDNIFASGLDARMMAAMPEFWKLYYQAAASKTDYRPADPAVLRQGNVDQKAKLVSTFEPASNQYAQDNGVAGMALYHAVIGADGKPGEVAVARPIGFGLDENAVEAIRNAKFEPALKDGKPVPVLLDLVVQFRIYSKRTAVKGVEEATDKSAPILPGPYSVQHQ